MTTKIKIVLGLVMAGALGAAYLILKPKGVNAVSAKGNDLPTPTPTPTPSETPYTPTNDTYVFLQNTEIKYGGGLFKRNKVLQSKSFKKGDYIEVLVKQGYESPFLATTIDGKKPIEGDTTTQLLVVPDASVKKVI
jgi:hypothetical protein